MIRQLPGWLKNTPVAHRGLHEMGKCIPENSLGAFENAIRHGYAIELDVQVIADGEVIVFHDYDLNRMCNFNREAGTLSTADLKYYTLSKTTENIPMLIDVLKLINGKVPLLVEIKRQPGGKNKNMIILNTLLSYKGEVAIQSFDPFVLGWFSKYAPFLIRGQLSSNFKGEKMSSIQKTILKNYILNFISKPDFLAHDVRDLPNPRLEQFRRKGIPVLGWTVSDEHDHKRIQPYCDNIIFESFMP